MEFRIASYDTIRVQYNVRTDVLAQSLLQTHDPAEETLTDSTHGASVHIPVAPIRQT